MDTPAFTTATGIHGNALSVTHKSLTCKKEYFGAKLATARTRRVRTTADITASSDVPVTQQLGSDDFLERIRGINRIEEISGTSEKVSALLPMATEDPNQQVRYAAICRIASFDHESLTEEDATKVLNAARFVMINDKESSCQSGAADVIAGLKLSDGFDDLVDMFNRTSDWMLKFSIAAGLGEMGDPKAFDFLTSILNNEESQDFLLITAAIGSLGELGDERGIPIVEKYLENEDRSIQERAQIAHGMLTGKK